MPDNAESNIPHFFSLCHRAVTDMREAGINDVKISFILSEIRAAALSEERLRLEIVAQKNPPDHWPKEAIEKKLSDFKDKQGE